MSALPPRLADPARRPATAPPPRRPPTTAPDTGCPLTDAFGRQLRYLRVGETGGRLDLITPLSHRFCEHCDRVRVSAAGRLYTCLGHDGAVDLAPALRAGAPDATEALIRQTLRLKPQGHDFAITRDPAHGIGRTMAALGG